MRHAFSLVELSIVLVILGLLAGGVLAGKSLIRASEMRTVGTEYQRWQTATSAFRDKYFTLPGDLANATSFWGMATCPGTYTTPGSGTATCNGNGDSIINNAEFYRSWQHLANAGLIEGTYTGVPSDAASLASLPGTNVPVSKLGQAGWSIYTIGTTSVSNAAYFEGSYAATLFFGTAVANWITQGNALKAEEAWNIDTKMDDARPGTGKIRAWEGSNCHDAGQSSTVALAQTANYALTGTALTCALLMDLQ